MADGPFLVGAINLLDKITQKFTDGYYKYWVGNFKSYKDAKTYTRRILKGALL